jgi:hypothetical protein
MLRHGLEYDAATRVLDRVSDAGEPSKLMLPAGDYGQRPLEDSDYWHEVGDTLYSLPPSALGVDAGLALDNTPAKHERHLRERGDPG